jgi:hypothetical protein
MEIMIFQILLFAYNVQGLGILGETAPAMVVSTCAFFTLGYSVYGLLSNNREALGWAVLATCILVLMRATIIFVVEGNITIDSSLSLATGIVLFGVYLDRDDI